MTGKCIKITIKLLYIYLHMRSALSTVNYHYSTMLMCNRSHFLNRIHYPKYIGYICGRYNLGSISNRLLNILQSDASVRLKWNIFKHGSGSKSKLLPRNEIAMMLHRSNHNFISGGNRRRSVG
ncbi:hypothetical protein D3C80_1570040 [compost metagenome]